MGGAGVGVLNAESCATPAENNGRPAAPEIPVRVPPRHLLCVPVQRPRYQPAAALHSTSVAGR